MFNQLAELANKLDSSGFVKEANEVDNIIKMAAESFTGAIVGIFVPKSIIKKFEDVKMNGKVDLESLHITLIYLGNSKDLEEKERKKIIKACEKVCKKYPPLKMRVSGFGKFLNKDETVIYAGIDSVGLAELRTDLFDAINKILELSNDRGFTPHMTLSYPQNKNTQLPKVEKMPKWTAKEVVIAFGNEHIKIPLEGDDEF